MTHDVTTRRAFLIGVAGTALVSPLAAQDLPNVAVTKDPSCGCCTGWVEHLIGAGFPVEVTEATDVNRLKARHGVPMALAACHTAQVAGYVVEGQVPASAIKRLLRCAA